MSTSHVSMGPQAENYLAMARLFSYPTAEAWQRLTEHGLVDPALTAEDLQAEYVAAFEVGRDGAAVPLFEGMHRGSMGRDGVLEDLLRFYEFFDVRLSEEDRDYPDHLVTELEFLASLCHREWVAQQQGWNAEPYRRAAKDFLERHLAAWLPEFSRKLERSNTAYEKYGSMLGKLGEEHRRQLAAAN
jgi:DMSO reductase family type II enzyme chaperone